MIKRYAGIHIPIFSLRSKRGLGTGEFLDLIPLIDWAKESGLKLIQLLPVNDTSATETARDASPYSIFSAFALHPLYLNIHAIAPEVDEEIKPIVKTLNLPHLDYHRTYLAKKELLKMIYTFRGEEDLSSKAFEKFFEANKAHLKSYAAFSFLRTKFGTSNFHKWGEFSQYSELLVDEICENEPVGFYYFVQFHLHKQLKEAHQYAKKEGIILKGDLPMKIQPHSVDAWRFHEYFDFDKKSHYRWDEIKEEGYFWLRKRLEWMEQYFDAVRLDHTHDYLGEKLKFIQKSTSMLLCAGELGAFEGILNLYIKKDPADAEQSFTDPRDFPEMSVCTPSTQDMAPLRAWWEEDEERAALYYHVILKHEGSAPKALTEDLAHQIIQAYLNSKSKLAIFLLQDLLAMSDGLKSPDPEAERLEQWNWRSPIYIEELLLAKSFSKQLRGMIEKSKRL